mmetsp:Transcript_66408/g.187102  ORF Transcript_66408/g.187102 Transcript_66408/m.187102 type:complete len:247 (-) Transcript_66408:813-1553(-)
MSSSSMSWTVQSAASRISAEPICMRISETTKGRPAIAAAAQNVYFSSFSGARPQRIHLAMPSSAPQTRSASRHSRATSAVRPIASAAASAAAIAAGGPAHRTSASPPAPPAEPACSCRRRVSTPRSRSRTWPGPACGARLETMLPRACTHSFMGAPEGPLASSCAMKSSKIDSASGKRESSSWSPTAFHEHSQRARSPPRMTAGLPAPFSDIAPMTAPRPPSAPSAHIVASMSGPLPRSPSSARMR